MEVPVAVVQRRLEHVHRSGSIVAESELVAGRPQGCMADDFRTPTEACYKVVENTEHLVQADTVHLAMEAKNTSA